MDDNNDLSMSFVDVFSLGFLGVLILYITSVKNETLEVQQEDYEVVSIEQGNNTMDHLAFVAIKNEDDFVFWANDNRINKFDLENLNLWMYNGKTRDKIVF